jgi:hypothetical protein
MLSPTFLNYLLLFFNHFNLHLSFTFPRNILLDKNKFRIIHHNIHILRILPFPHYKLHTLKHKLKLKQKWQKENYISQYNFLPYSII